MFLPTDIVVVTGANGHLASHIVDQLLAFPDGPRVRGTVRSQESRDTISEYYGGKEVGSRLEVFCVPDMLGEGAFDEVVEGATHIAHVASPLVIGRVTDVAKELLDPAILGTTGIFKAAHKTRSIRAVVITSSFGAAFDPAAGWRPSYTYTSVRPLDGSSNLTLLSRFNLD
ncbi:hypothetical protein P7C70_g9231, partial [Phenoliferia sp. Uapishka_3]